MEVLLFQDDPALASEYSEALVEGSFQVEVAASIRQGLERVVNQPPDLAVVDGELRDADSIALCRELRALRTAAQLPIIFVSSRFHAVHEYRVLAEEVGIDLLLHKPVIGRVLAVHANRLAADVIRDTALWHTPPSIEIDLADIEGLETDATTEEQLAQSVADIRHHLAKKLSTKLPVLRKQLNGLVAHPAKAGFAKLAKQLQRTRRSCDLYGLQTASEILEQMEESLVQALGGGNAPSPKQIKGLHRGFERLESIVIDTSKGR